MGPTFFISQLSFQKGGVFMYLFYFVQHWY